MLKILFVNWWDNGSSDFFLNYCKKYIYRKVKISDDKPHIIFYSVFGNKNKIIDCVKNNKNAVNIFFIGESTKNDKSPKWLNFKHYDDYLLNIVDISLGFKYIDHPKYIRFPLWITYINFADSNMGEHRSNFDNLLTKKFKNKTNFCCMLSNHDHFNTRTKIFEELNKYKKIDSAGNLKNNHPKIGKDQKYKYRFLENYKFNICCESLIEKGYVTEKIFDSLICGCIPIYIVNDINDNIEDEILNQDFILKFTNNNINDVINKIKHIDSNHKYFNRYFNKDILKKNAIKIVHQKYNKLKELILKDFKKQ